MVCSVSLMVMPIQVMYYFLIYTDPHSIASVLLLLLFQDSPLYDPLSLLTVLIR